MLQKQIYIGQINGSKIYVHISLILSTILAWSVVTLITKPALGFGYSYFLYGSIAFMSAAILLLAKIGYEIGRLSLVQNQGMEISKLVLLPLSGLLIYEQEHPRHSMGFWASFMPIFPLIGSIASFSLFALLPAAGEFQIVVLRGIALSIIFFAFARLIGAFSVDRLNTIHGLMLRFTNNSRLADFVHEVWRNFSIAGILIAAVAVSPTYRWLGIALAITIAWGLYDAILYREANELNIKIERFKSHTRKIKEEHARNTANGRVLN